MKAHKSTGWGLDMTSIIPEWKHVAILYSIIDLWTVLVQSKQYGDKWKRMVLLSWELPELTHEFREGEWEKPCAIHQRFTFSMYQNSQLRKTIESFIWKKLSDKEAEDFEISNLLWKMCQLQLYHNGQYVNIQTVINLTDSEKKWYAEKWIKQVNPSKLLDLDDFNEEVFNSLSDNMQKKISETEEYQSLFNEQATDEDEDLPF